METTRLSLTDITEILTTDDIEVVATVNLSSTPWHKVGEANEWRNASPEIIRYAEQRFAHRLKK